MATQALILLGLLAALALAAEAAPCDQPSSFRCRDHKCIPGRYRCDYRKHCDDGSDEEDCEELLKGHAVPLPATASVTAVVHYEKQHGGIVLQTCVTGVHCSQIVLASLDVDDDSLRYITEAECTLGAKNCVTQTLVPEHKPIPSGKMTLEVEHRRGQLVVRRKNRRSDVVIVPVDEDFDTLRIRPHNWATNMSVEFECATQCPRSSSQKLRFTPLAGGRCLAIMMDSKPEADIKPKKWTTLAGPFICGDRSKECQLQWNTVAQFGTEYSNSTTSESSPTIGAALTVGSDLKVVQWAATLSYEYSSAMAETQSHGWTEQTAKSTTFVCQASGGYTTWLRVRPEYYVKEGVIINEDCSNSTLVKWFPRTEADGSIGGTRMCDSKKTTQQDWGTDHTEE